jgi:hypothetical protein
MAVRLCADDLVLKKSRHGLFVVAALHLKTPLKNNENVKTNFI